MHINTFLITVLAGFSGTVLMTAFMYLYAAISGKQTKVVHVLGAMIAGAASSLKVNAQILAAGAFAHTMIGLFFSFSYFLLWNWGFFQINLADAILLGAITGLMAIIVWLLYFYLHQNPPKLSRGHYAVALLIAHIIFAVATVYVFQLIKPDPQFWFKM